MPARACGDSRTEGAAYLELPLGPDGDPIERFLLCPPVQLGAFKVPALGMTMLEAQGTWHLFDRIGSDSYPNVADWIEETRAFGLSRKIAATMDFSRITTASRLYTLHARAWIDGTESHWRRMGIGGGPMAVCPKSHPDHEPFAKDHPYIEEPPMCARLYWEDLLTPQAGGIPGIDFEYARRELPGLAYHGRSTPTKKSTVTGYEIAIFGKFPIARIAVVRGAADSHLATLARAQAARVPVYVADE